MPVTIGNKTIGDTHPCFITFEAGPTHDGLESAKRLVKLAAEAGADAVKFQIFDPDKLVADKQMTRPYEILVDRETGETEIITETLYDILSRRCLHREEWIEVKRYSDELDLAFFATVGFEEDINLLVELGCHSIKIASADINHWPLIRTAAKTGMCIQLDTGNATVGELEDAVEVCRSEGNEKIIIHNCPSGYPARLESINLNFISTLKRMFPNYAIAYSDHTPGWEMDVAAVALGANLVEKTITMDRTTRSIEHIFSLEPGEMEHFIKTVRDVEIAMGTTRRVLHPEQRKDRLRGRRSAFVKQAVGKGKTVSLEDIEFRRPGYGIAPHIFESLQNYVYSKDLQAGHRLSFADLDEP
ncbi:N-acetylneuraminate synthase family protein [Desulfonatronovibrio hydrogenovorans]|uniref:N-acetylneuraminate synthase family protein n=1 Tax=Desulfonatronovibrio hydrogenovorans TaxID=53245 RepID=UPI00048D12F9|nr:N-acetylneuraminate synthase family protein [Desulfonatronovibrio hydrogenovorans]